MLRPHGSEQNVILRDFLWAAGKPHLENAPLSKNSMKLRGLFPQPAAVSVRGSVRE